MKPSMEDWLAILVFATRILLSIALLVIIWKHSHWSVALAISLMYVRSEMGE